MSGGVPLTRRAQQHLAGIIQAGSLVVDATVGNGFDTLFLAQQVGSSGHVWGFDVQADALTTAAALIEAHGLTDRVTLIHAGHQHLDAHLPACARGRLDAVMFNLGYLPGSDKRLTTITDTTLTAVAAAAANLSPGGLLSILAYQGHLGGRKEADAVDDWLRTEGTVTLEVETLTTPGPVLHLARRYTTPIAD